MFCINTDNNVANTDIIELFKLKLNLLLTYLIFGATAKASAAAVPAVPSVVLPFVFVLRQDGDKEIL